MMPRKGVGLPKKARRAMVLLTVVLMLGVLDAPAAGTMPAEETRGPAPLAGEPGWHDDLDDLSHVYVNATMPVGVEVSGGDAHLRAGMTDGWLASEVIECPEGYRYDLVLVEVDTPGNSSVEVSVLDADSPPKSGDLANATLEGLERRQGPDLSLNAVNATAYPRVRVQVDLHADGTDMPRLLAWSVTFVDRGEWREDFLGSGKMMYARSVNVTGGSARLDLSRRIGDGIGNHDPYPLIGGCLVRDCTGGPMAGIFLYYPDEDHSDYTDYTHIPNEGHQLIRFADLDKDDDLDLVAPNFFGPSSIYWADATGRFSVADRTDLVTDGGAGVGIGDFNKDGWEDIVIGGYGGGPARDTSIFLNDQGSFNTTSDHVLDDMDYGSVNVGDLNDDGYDDLVGNRRNIHLGGPDGFEHVPDLTFPTPDLVGEISDLNGDGHADLLGSNQTAVKVYYGGSGGPSTTADAVITPAFPVLGVGLGVSGDLNMDGFQDIVVIVAPDDGSNLSNVLIFEGAEDGWSSSRVTKWPAEDYRTVTVLDVDVDGFDDIIFQGWFGDEFQTKMALGGVEVPTGPDRRLVDMVHGPLSPALPETDPTKLIGVMWSEPIHLPDGMKWDVLDLRATIPEGTSVRTSMLDGSGKTIEGYQDLPDTCIDLMKVPANVHQRIRVKVVLTSEANDTTPVLEGLVVKWVDQMAWRDAFHGAFRTERLHGLQVEGGRLEVGDLGGTAPQLLVTSLRGDVVYNPRSRLFLDSGGTDYLTRAPLPFETTGAMAAAVADANGDGHLDVAFAAHSRSTYDFDAVSMVFLGSPVGWRDLPHWTHNTTGARDVLMEDLDGDGHVDLVLAQEQDGVTYSVDSLLFLGTDSGWGDEPDVRFRTKGASGVCAKDIDGDGNMDLVFACYSDDSSTDTDSMVFLQGEDGFDGDTPDARLATHGARAVAAGDLNGDEIPDLVFANSRTGTGWGAQSSVFLGKEGGGFSNTLIKLPTQGAQDVKVEDLDGDGDRDIVFANLRDGDGDHSVGSPVFLNDGHGGFPASPTATLATTGAMAVEVTDLDGRGWKDLVFACCYDGASYEQTSVGYLGGASGWPAAPDVRVATPGATDVLAVHMFERGRVGYMSQTIAPADIEGTGGFHTFRYTASLEGAATGSVQVYDAVTWERLASAPLEDGSHEWDLQGVVYYKHHNRIRMVVEAEGVAGRGDLELDDLYINWTPRREAPPEVLDVMLGAERVYRMNDVVLSVTVNDEYDRPEELRLTLEHLLEGDPFWSTSLLSPLEFADGVWSTTISLGPETLLGTYRFRARAVDTDDMMSATFESRVRLEVLNNLPTAPEVEVSPASPLSGDTLKVTITRSAQDAENTGLTYRFAWYRNGARVSSLSGDSVPPDLLARGQNWSVEVTASDGDDEGPPARAWVVIGNTPPRPVGELPELTIEEDGEAQTFELASGFLDVDGDILTYGVEEGVDNLTVEVDEHTGRVSLAPVEDWYGATTVAFWVSDGEHMAWQHLAVNVTPVNDPPRLTEINGEPVPSGVMVLTVLHGQTLVITYSYNDVEGDRVMLSVDSGEVTLDDFLREIRFTPTDDMVGTVTFTLTIWDLASPDERQTLDFQIVVENVNDPPDDPLISAPPDGSTFEVGEAFDLVGACDDPDLRFGQVLTFTWSSDVSGVLGTGPRLNVSLSDLGAHVITLTVGDGEFERSATVTVTIVPVESVVPPPPPKDDEGLGLWVPLVVVLVAVGLVLAAAVSTEPGKYRWGLMMAPLLIKKDEVLDNKTRYALHGIITEKPGIHYSAIKDEFGLSNGEAAYHLDVLERENFIRSVRDGRLKRFYSSRTKVPKDRRMTPEEIRETILEVVKENPDISQMELIEELGVDRDTVGYHLRELVKEDQLEADKQWRYTVYRVR
jgi:predicted transcriptional regulator